MQKESSKQSSSLLDSLGRRNRKHADKSCAHCGDMFRPKRADSKYCSSPCKWANNGKQQTRKPEVWWTNPKGYVEGRVTVNGQTKTKKLHRHLMESHIGRDLLPNEDVHHINGIKSDNRIENLQVIDHGEHSRLSNKARSAKAKGEA